MEVKILSILYSTMDKNTLLLFDVDGTLCLSGQTATTEMKNTLTAANNRGFDLAIIGGGTYDKITYQMGDIKSLFTYICTENGIVSYKGDYCVLCDDLRNHWDNHKLTQIVDCLLRCLLSLDDLPVKTGKFIDLRRGLIYFSLIGQNCTYEERQLFKKMDKNGDYRIKVINRLKEEFPIFEDIELSLGGELGISVSPGGWDKSFVKNVIDLDQYDHVYFYGDKLEEWGSDYPMRKIDKVTCHSVKSPSDCIQLINSQI